MTSKTTPAAETLQSAKTRSRRPKFDPDAVAPCPEYCDKEPGHPRFLDPVTAHRSHRKSFGCIADSKGGTIEVVIDHGEISEPDDPTVTAGTMPALAMPHGITDDYRARRDHYLAVEERTISETDVIKLRQLMHEAVEWLIEWHTRGLTDKGQGTAR